MTRYFQFQAFIGPRFLPYTDACCYPWYIGFPVEDAAVDLDYKTNVVTSLTNGAVTLVTTNDSALYNKFPQPGGLWLGPGGAGQGWEHVDFAVRTNATFTGLRRELAPYRDHNGAHSAGAEVRFWYPITSDSGEFHFMDELTPELAVRSWRFELRGFVLPPSLLRNDFFVAVCYRNALSGSLKVFALGISDSVQIRDDFERKGQWTLFASSLRGMCENTMVHGVQFGDLNVAQGAQVQSSAPLGSPYKEILSGDYGAAEPDLRPDSAVDGVMDTLFISDFMVGSLVNPTYDGVTQLYLNPHPGRGPAYKWIELTNYSTESSTLKAYDPVRAGEITLDFADFAVASGDYRVILTDDAVTFARENPASEADYVVEVPKVGLGPDFMKWCNPAGGAIAIWGPTGLVRMVAWGNVNLTTLAALWSFDAGDWRGPALAAPGYGQTIAYRHDIPEASDNDNLHWAIRDYGTPGYLPRPDRGDRCWLALYLPGLGLFVRDDVAVAETTIYIVDAAGDPSTEGLPASGTVQFGAQQVIYAAKTSSSLTGCAVGYAIEAGALVTVVQNGIATDGFPLAKIVLRRPVRSGAILLSEYYLRVSRVLSRLPDSSDYATDYAAPYGAALHISGNSLAETTWTLTTAGGEANVRARTIVLEFRRMTVDPACGRLNELEAAVDVNAFSAAYFVASPTNPGEALFRLLQQVGIPAGCVNYSAVTRTVSIDFRTARDWAWKTLADVCDMTGIAIDFRRGSRIYMDENPFYTTAVGGYTPLYTWDQNDVAVVDWVARAGEGVGQIRMLWESLAGELSGTETYPAVPGERGAVVEIGPFMVVNAASAQLSARKRFYLRRAPFFAVCEMVDCNLAIVPGQIFQLSWPFPGDNVDQVRRYIVQGVDFLLAAGVATQVVTGLVIDWEAG